MANPMPKISDAEWEVMKILWENPNFTANEVIEALRGNSEWKPITIRTMINRLVQKSAVGYSSDGKVYSYYPLVQQEECLRAETMSFLKRITGGALKPMLIHFLREESLSKEDINELRNILDEKI
ncbi:BlaI/MecI/CopY family transcriptional regulator [Cohnella suwonensis]|uniref:BlaI/MecI/CopY family transcriptional regulator n=1 Tax=Cohnella suwonensis TaxID=696072 RepID=A0ABW0LYS4_9BACL